MQIETLQGFLRAIDSPPFPARSKLASYLLRFDFVAYNYNLKKDLQKLSSQTNADWAVPGHPAYEYLYGQPAQPCREVIMLGAFPVHPPTESQALALKHTIENPVTAVVGPPGNGKTTLLLHKIAQQVVKRAVNLATTGQDKSNLTIVTSTNNRAVNNVNERLSTSFPTDQFYLSGGAKALNIKQVLPRLQAAVDTLQGATFDSAQWSQAKQQLVALQSNFQHYLHTDQLNQQQRALDLELLEQLNTDIQAILATIEASRIEPPSSNQPDYSQFPFDAYVEIKKHLEAAKRSLPRLGKANNFVMRLVYQLKRLWHSLTQTTERHVFKRLHQQISSPVLATLATPFPFQIPLNRSAVVSTILSVEQQLQTAYSFQSGTSDATSLTKLEEYSQQMQSLLVDREQVEKRLRAYPQFDFYTRQSTEYHDEQVELFKVSNSFLQMEALRRKSEVCISLETYIGVLNDEWDAKRKLARDWSSIYADLSLLFPVITSTLHSIRNLLPFPDSGCIGQLIVDEAGMIKVHQLFPALVRSQQALVVGDPLQIEPVVSFNNETLEEYRATAFLARGLKDSDYERYSPTADTTAYHRAAGASGESGDLGKGITLKEHYRCATPIISFCDRLCNYGLVIKTPHKASAIGPNLLAYHVEGNYQNHINPEEIEATEAIINHLLDYGYCVDESDNEKNIGVISPYRRQADALRTGLQSRWKDFSDDSIGTVHTFQGGEKSVIILCTRQCRDSDSLWFINRKPNLLNVAVSRAKELFILVGNLERLKEGGYTRLLVEHIQQYGEIRTQHPSHWIEKDAHDA